MPLIEASIRKLPKNRDGVTLEKSDTMISKMNDVLALGLATPENLRYFLNQRLYALERTNVYEFNYGLDDPNLVQQERLLEQDLSIEFANKTKFKLLTNKEKICYLSMLEAHKSFI
jgi:hypothetical protein